MYPYLVKQPASYASLESDQLTLSKTRGPLIVNSVIAEATEEEERRGIQTQNVRKSNSGDEEDIPRQAKEEALNVLS